MGKKNSQRDETIYTHGQQQGTTINVIQQQPLGFDQERHSDGEWKTGLCECSDSATCWQATCCWSKLRKIITNDLGKKAFNRREKCLKCPCVCCVTLCCQRGQVRRKYDIDGNNCLDCILATWCYCCVLNQIVRHLPDEKYQVELKRVG
ncbi:Oidioi.mRNA.OKI2018_I69.XSR.g14938.t1.cds [Oikopleura dioica]|uniref:Oidioi.mRNA.OKI2018_I69.XSR.g14938.t1.cds n=1 Tax=Oikopleura dioica TaxID=34765 RepID=A0ABN7SBR0_OIKDI|nr:Oidioi.mRNA.OKI2018_I69.XSR.g14938.t1.cds [Oikopleura dioica]